MPAVVTETLKFCGHESTLIPFVYGNEPVQVSVAQPVDVAAGEGVACGGAVAVDEIEQDGICVPVIKTFVPAVGHGNGVGVVKAIEGEGPDDGEQTIGAEQTRFESVPVPPPHAAAALVSKPPVVAWTQLPLVSPETVTLEKVGPCVKLTDGVGPPDGAQSTGPAQARPMNAPLGSGAGVVHWIPVLMMLLYWLSPAKKHENVAPCARAVERNRPGVAEPATPASAKTSSANNARLSIMAPTKRKRRPQRSAYRQPTSPRHGRPRPRAKRLESGWSRTASD